MGRILIVEDEDCVALSLQTRLEQKGISCMSVDNLESMWEELEKSNSQENPDNTTSSIILDIMLPEKKDDMNINEEGGLIALERLYKDYPTIPVIINTGRGDDACEAKAEKYKNVHAFYRKPATRSIMEDVNSILNPPS